MPFSSTVFNVLIASPSDVPEERATIAQSLHEWNSLQAQDQGKILLPVMWETHSAPAMGDRPQGLINEQVVRGCDILIGSFWTRLGSPTGIEESGTVEEIKWFLANKKPVMLYFSKAHVELDSVDLSQYQKLKEFKQSIRDKGIQEEYRSISELREKLSRQLTIVMREMSVGPVIDKKTVAAAKASTRTGELFVLEKEEAAPDTNEVFMEDYTEKAFIVRGNTIDYKEAFKGANGRWISVKGGKAWMFSKRHLKDVAKILKLKPVLRPAG
ncbi:hypothetical protein [Mesorhizobium sp. LSJC264A00]|uniref:hypothetical protein n=1 Tax=unclassified Mesorhizobium TaxID=325217 RepID=UPI0003CF021E|nr:hypothetical protein [Mesorhizobium sp. LSJC264A00]ESX21372.1 hypothetical protein X767_20245 [Mesorhizobium sp. LSJC264A00]